MKSEKIGELFVKAGLLAPATLAHVLEENRKHPEEKLGQTLIRLKLASDTDIARALSLQFNIPYIDLQMVVIDPYAVKRIPAELATQHHMLPIYIEKNNLVLAMENPLDFEATEAARFASGLNIRPHVTSLSEILNGIKRYYSIEETVAARMQNVPAADKDMEYILQNVRPSDQQLDELKKQSESPAIVKMVNTMILQGLAVRASAIQIDPQKQDVMVRNRVDGALVDSMRLPKWTQGALISRLKIMADMDFTKRLIPQKGRTKLKMQQRIIEMEMSCLPAQHGECMIINILDTGETIPLIQNLGFLPDEMTKVHKFLWLPQGLTIICGPHGSGKTTTLYALASELLRHQRKIITIEDKIEYQLKGAQQVQLNEQAGLTYAQAFQSVLRHNPDVILLGELRDKETADMALNAAKKGHVVLSATRTEDVISTLTRLRDLGVNAELLAASLSGIITQRLVRKICPLCRETYTPSPKLIEAVAGRIGEAVTGTFTRGKGCAKCNFTGYLERAGAYHVMLMNPGLRKLILQGTPKSGTATSISKIERALLIKNILEKAKQGVTTLEELERVLLHAVEVPKADEITCPHCHRPIARESQVCPACQRSLQEPPAALPGVEQIQKPTQIATPKESKGTSYIFKGYKILLVDQETALLKQLQQILAEKDFTVSIANDGEAALDLVAREKPHLVITEVTLPKLDGLELIRRLRKNVTTTFIPVIIVSAKGDTNDRIKGFAAGTDDYVPKPFSMHELFFRINALLRRTYK